MNNFKANSDETLKEMLTDIGVKETDDLFSMIDQSVRMQKLDLPDAISEMQTQKVVKSIAKENKTDYDCFIGGGSYKRFIPAAVSAISSRFEFNTAYTPYQPEISQGTLQVIYEFQSMMCDITGMDVCNASVYDAGSACAEAMRMAVRNNGSNKILVSECLNPEYKKVIETYAHAGYIEVETVTQRDFRTDIKTVEEKLKSGEYAGLIIQNPNYFGSIEDIDVLKTLEKAQKTLLIVCVEAVSACVLTKPSEYNADIVVGDVQSFGNPMSFGGPSAGFIATLDKYKRQLAGRIVGRTLDADGKQAFTLTLQAREQHIRREKATSNICSNQGLAILNALVYLSLLGKNGVKQAAYLSTKNAHSLAEGLKNKGYNVLNNNFFNEFVIETKNSDEFLKKMKNSNILAGLKVDNTKVLVCTTEINTKEDIENYIQKA